MKMHGPIGFPLGMTVDFYFQQPLLVMSGLFRQRSFQRFRSFSCGPQFYDLDPFHPFALRQFGFSPIYSASTVPNG
jgi:hypothetical protein